MNGTKTNFMYYKAYHSFGCYCAIYIGINQLEGGHGGGKSHWAELTPEFRSKHYLVGLVISHLSNAFNQV